MDYLLENLGDERFQELCQALLVREFPKTQCFPVGQRDGGRDAISYPVNVVHDKFIVFQVKYVKNPERMEDPHKWLTKVVEEESPKIKRLLSRGASEYYLLTNVPGTAFPEHGAIDRVQSIFSDAIPIPSQCWWRDDLARRLDDAWNVKWVYPEILSGPDVLRLILQSGLSDDVDRRTNAINAFVTDQQRREQEVRFKQIELLNNLFDLFVDVPVNLRAGLDGKTMTAKEHRALQSLVKLVEKEPSPHFPKESSVGAATMLLDSRIQTAIPRIVLEGAPGQGKSTIVQYLCQIHRSRVLGTSLDIDTIPQNHRIQSVRLPIKVDCRDLAQWLKKKNPFSADDTEGVPATWQDSLESFLSALISYYSGGFSFATNDFVSVAKVSAMLLVFDGLDEVADIEMRRDVVNEIVAGVHRLTQNAASLQVVVTSRPAALANAPGMPDDDFRYFDLSALTTPLIEEYSAKWVKARRLEVREAQEVRKILRGKVDQPHLRELARNAMQLAILLSLIHTRGISLPDKRTALYDSYVDLFFDREAEKSTVIRENRDLLINIHRYLAWVLHEESQTRESRGNVTADELMLLVQKYLAHDGHDVALAGQLFSGMIERVVALVSRVEGTYEFEVQPLREYFAARYLYDTAPYSPPGAERRGTRPDRFEALVRDFFWQNVTRFYAGCYSKGELTSLVDGLDELSKADGYRYTTYSQLVAATLLSDWVFAQQPKLMRKVVDLVLGGPGLRTVSAVGRPYRSEAMLLLPHGNGNEELVDRCFAELQSDPADDYAVQMIRLIYANSDRQESYKRWEAYVTQCAGPERTRWMKYGLYFGALPNAPDSLLSELLSEEIDLERRYKLIFRAGRVTYLESDPNRFRRMCDCIVDGNCTSADVRRGDSTLETLSQVFRVARFEVAFEARGPATLAETWQYWHSREPFEELRLPKDQGESELQQKCNSLIQRCIDLSDRPTEEWATSLAPWDAFVEKGRELLGERWALSVLANAAAGIRSKAELCDDATDFFDSSLSLCRRMRFARLRASNASWWQEVLAKAATDDECCLSLLVFFTWAGPTVLVKLAPCADEVLRKFDESRWRKVYNAVRSSGYGQERRDLAVSSTELPGDSSERLIVALSTRLRSSASDEVFKAFLADYSGDDVSTLDYCVQMALRAATSAPSSWDRWLPIIAKNYRKGGEYDPYLSYRYSRIVQPHVIPADVAQQIVHEASLYPIEVVGVAEQKCRQEIAAIASPVGKIARREKWFDDE